MSDTEPGSVSSVLRPGDPGYEEARRVWNGMIDRRPAMIVRCRGTADVVRAVRFARERELLVSVRGGGHHVAGLAICEGGMVIDCSPMRGVHVDPAARTARAQSGCRLGDVDRETQVHGLAAVLGFISDTGIAGLTLGGGLGWLTRRFGFSCDTLVSLEMVTADGRVVRAAADENVDLFWALRGGGGNFGVVTSFQYRVFPVGPEVLGGLVAFRAEDAPAVLRRYREISTSAPRELTSMLVLGTAPPAPWIASEHRGRPMIGFGCCWSGSPGEGERWATAIRASAPPIGDTLARRPYAELQCLFDSVQPPGRRYHLKSHYLPAVPAALDEVLLSSARRLTSPGSSMLLLQVGGALEELAPEDSPVGNRDARYLLNVAAGWDDPTADAAHVGWARDTWAATRPFSTGGTYVNFLTEDDGPDRIEAAYGRATLARLATIKRRWDPTNFFRHTKSVLTGCDAASQSA